MKCTTKRPVAEALLQSTKRPRVIHRTRESTRRGTRAFISPSSMSGRGANSRPTQQPPAILNVFSQRRSLPSPEDRGRKFFYHFYHGRDRLYHLTAFRSWLRSSRYGHFPTERTRERT